MVYFLVTLQFLSSIFYFIYLQVLSLYFLAIYLWTIMYLCHVQVSKKIKILLDFLFLQKELISYKLAWLFHEEDLLILNLFFWLLALQINCFCKLDCIFSINLLNCWFVLRIKLFSWHVLIFSLLIASSIIYSTLACTHKSCIFILALFRVEQLSLLLSLSFQVSLRTKRFLSFCLWLCVSAN